MKPIKYNCDYCGSEIIRRPGPTLHFCNKICKGEYQRTFKPVSKEWLIEHYIDKGLDTTQIAHIVNRDPKSVWNWLKDFNIPTRPRGSFAKNHFANGHKGCVGRVLKESTKQKIRESRIKDGRLPCFKNGVHWMHDPGYNKTSHPKWRGGISPERQVVYSSEEWCESVKKVWARDNATCVRCGKHHNEAENRGTFHIHHITSFMVKELRTNIENLVLLCHDCHIWVHGKTNKNKEFMKGE